MSICFQDSDRSVRQPEEKAETVKESKPKDDDDDKPKPRRSRSSGFTAEKEEDMVRDLTIP